MAKQHKGLRLGTRSSEGRFRWLRCAPVCGVFLAALARITDFGEPLLLIAAGMGTCVLIWQGGWRWSAVLGAMLAVAVLFRAQVMNGFCLFWNDLGDAYTAGTGVVVPELTGEGEGMTAFSILSGMAAGVIVSALHGQEWLLMVICTAAAALFGRMPEMFGMMLLSVVLLMKPQKGRLRGFLVPVCLLLALTLAAQRPALQNWTARQSEQLLQTVHTLRYESGGAILPEGDPEKGLNTSGDRTALVVTMEQSETLYLRGFTGAMLENNVWKPLDTEILQQQEDLLYWLNCHEFHLLNQFEAAAGEGERNTVTVQYVSACSAYRYVPFTLCADESISAEYISPDHVPGVGAYDRFTTVYQGAQNLSEILESIEDQEYLQAEAAYRTFVRAHYLDIPEVRQALAEAWEQAETDIPQEAVRDTLELLYPDGPERTPEYAADAVLTLRRFGIPARYAEGYIVPESEGESIRVTAGNAACWAEVYHDGLGWMPMALTPGMEKTEPEMQPEQTPEEVPEESTAETIPQEVPQPDDGWQVRVAQLITNGVLLVIDAVLLVLLGLYLRRRWVLKKREELFCRTEPTESLGWIFADSIKLLTYLDLKPGNGSLDPLEGILRDRFGGEYADLFAAAAELNKRSLFSSHPLSDADRRTVLGFRANTAELLKKHSAWYRKLWMQWVLCLY